MPEQKILLNDQTTYEQVKQFFSGLDDEARVRARNGDDGVELYVRGSSTWHIFTDKLRLARDVKKDYQKAKDKLLSIFNGSKDTDATYLLSNTKKLIETTRDHKHDFRATQFNSYFKDVAVAEAEQKTLQGKRLQSEAKNRLDLAWRHTNFSIRGRTWIKERTQALLNDTKRFDASENAEIQRQAGEFSKYVKNKVDSNAPSEEIDYVAAEKFAFSWKKTPERTLPKASDHEPIIKEKLLTKLVSRITEQSMSQQLDMSAGPIGESAADLIIMDPHSNYRGYTDMVMSGKFISTSHTESYQSGDETVNFSLVDRRRKEQTSTRKFDNALEITHDEDFQKVENSLQILYDKVGKAIAAKIASRGQQSSDKYTIHMTIPNPSGYGSAPDKTSHALRAFVDATNQWLGKYPNLQIKVQLPPGVSEQDMLRIYRESRAQPATTSHQPASTDA